MSTTTPRPAPARARFWPRARDVPKDLGAGITVALVSVAEGMAYALVAGVDPIYGLYAGSITVIVGSLFASSTLLMVTATNALALVAADKIGALGPGVDPATAMFTLTLLVGVVMTVLGVLRLGSLTKFISAEVSAGLVAAVAMLILLGQYKDLVGYSSTLDVGKVGKAIDITRHVPSWNGPTLVIGLGCIAILIVVKRTALRSYADIFALVIGTAAVSLFHLDSVETVRHIATIPTGFASIPTPHLPDLSLAPALIPAAIAAAVVGLSEASTVGAAYPNPSGRRSDVSRDFVAQGAANLVGGFFRTMVVGGSLSRTGVNESAGARSRWSGVYAGALLIALVAVAGGLAELIPLCTLAAILIVIGFETLIREVGHLLEARWISVPHLVAGGITFLVGIFFELTDAIFVGVALSLLLFVFTIGDSGKFVAWGPIEPDRWKEIPPPERLEPGSITVMSLAGSAYFASFYRASEAMPDYKDTTGAVMVLQMRNRKFYSLTGLDYITELVNDLKAHGHLVVLSDLEVSQKAELERTGLVAVVGAENIVWRSDVIGEAATEAYAIGTAWLAEQAADHEGPA